MRGFSGIAALFRGLPPFSKERGAARTAAPAAPPAPVQESTSTSCSTIWPPYFAGGSPLTIATVYRCVRLLSESVAQLPVRYMVRRGGFFSDEAGTAADAELRRMLSVEPDLGVTSYQFWSNITRDIIMGGNAYVALVRDAIGRVMRLAYCNPLCVGYDSDSGLYTVSDRLNAVSGRFAEADVLHFRGLGPDPRHGMGVIAYARKVLDVAHAGDAETLDRFRRGGAIKGIVANPSAAAGSASINRFSTGELKKVSQSLDERFNVNGERIVEVGYDAKFLPFAMSSADMQFLESRKFSVREICRFFGVHPSFVFDDTSNNYKSAEMANSAFLSNTLNPILASIENELLIKLVPPSLAADRRIEFDRRALFSANLESKAQYYQTMMQCGAFTPNEVRRMENLPPLEGGDALLVSSALRGAGEQAPPPQAS